MCCSTTSRSRIFTDPNPNDPLSDYSADIDWGDGNYATGIIVPEGSGNYAVVGSNTFAQAGTFTVTVALYNGVNFNSTTAATTYTIAPADPVILGLSSSSGPLSGGVAVTIFGPNLLGATAVTFGSTPASLYSINPDGSITAVAPAGSLGTVDVRVTSPTGTSSTTANDTFTYLDAAPTVTSLGTTSGPTGGGTAVTITGTDLQDVTQVLFGGVNSTFAITSNTSIVAIAPAQASGPVDITLVSNYGTSATSVYDVFTFDGTAPTISAIDTTAGPSAGGTLITITGTNLFDVSSISFGGTAATDFASLDGNTLIVVAPAVSPSTIDITVSNPTATSSTSSADLFTFVDAPTVSSLGTTSGPTGAARPLPSPAPPSRGQCGVLWQCTSALFPSRPRPVSPPWPLPERLAPSIFPSSTVGGSSTLNSGDEYTYTGTTPSITAVSPAAVPRPEVRWYPHRHQFQRRPPPWT